MAYGDFKDLNRRTAADKVLRDKAFNILLKIENMMGFSVDLLQWFINILIKNTASLVDKSTFGETVKNEIILNK